jgi:hypothetical protein
MSEFTKEKIVRICHDEGEILYEVRPDRDGWGLVEILYRDNAIKCALPAMSPEAARLIADALRDVANDVDPQEADDE